MSRTGVDTDDSGDEDPSAWLASGFQKEEASRWRRWRFTIAQAQAWMAQGVNEGLEAAQWLTSGVTPETVDDWRTAGIAAGEAVQWHEMGFTFEQVRTQKSQGRTPTAAFRASGQVRGASARMSGWAVSSPLMARGRAGPGGPIQSFQDAGVDPRTMHSYVQHGWVDEDAVAWARHGIEASDAYVWFDLGLKPSEAGRLVDEGRTPGDVVREWWSAGIPFEEVAEWIGAGLSAAEALEQRARGITAEHAASLRALRIDESDPGLKMSSQHSLMGRMGPPSIQAFGPPPADAAAARMQVEEAFADMMTADEAGNISSVEGGSNLGPCLDEAKDRHRIRVNDDLPGVTVQADAVRFVNDHEARVLFSIQVGDPMNRSFGNRIGRAVYIDGQWKVARETFCEFMSFAGVQCPPRP